VLLKLQGRIRLPHHPRPFDFGNGHTIGLYLLFFFVLFLGVKFCQKEKI
jgi:hypothetical protein